MVCGDHATGHCVVIGGEHDGRMISVVCLHHASPGGVKEFNARLREWLEAGLISPAYGPGDDGCPEVWHGDHLDPLPDHSHH